MYTKLRSKFFTFLSLLLMLTGLSLSPAFTPPAMAQTTQNFIFSVVYDVNHNSVINFSTDVCVRESMQLKVKDNASSLQYIVTLVSSASYVLGSSSGWNNCVLYSSSAYAIQTGKTYTITTVDPANFPYIQDGLNWTPGYSGSWSVPKQLMADY